MSYRNDHDAALARVDALESEIARIKGEQLPAPSAEHIPARPPWALLAALGASSIVGLGFGIAAGAHADAVQSPQARQVGRIERALLERCADHIQPSPHFTAELADPRAAKPVNVDAIVHTGAACRDDLRTFIATSMISNAEHAQLSTWLATEDELSNSISMIVTYYGSDPYRLDGYSTARQLWLEYDRAYFQRKQALERWRGQLSVGYEY